MNITNEVAAAVRRAAAADGIGGLAGLGVAIGIGADKARAVVWAWTNRGVVPIEYCAAIERATEGTVTRRDLRPTDWWLIWPELVTAEHPAPLPVPKASPSLVD